MIPNRVPNKVPNKVPLTDSQIKEICEVIPYNKALPSVIANNIRNRIVQPLIEQLKHVRLYPDPTVFQNFKDRITAEYYSSLIAPGEAVGIQMAQSIGERATQQTLNSFHSAGLSIKTVTKGVPRFSELLSATKAPKMVNCIIYLQKEYSSIEEVMKDVGTQITEVKIKKILLDSKYTYKVSESIEEWHCLFWKAMYDCELPKEKLGWRVRLVFNKELLYEYKIEMKHLAKRIEKEYADVFVCYTPEYVGIVDVFINNEILPLPTTHTNSEDPYELSEELAELYNYFDNKVIPSLQDLLVCGIPGIKEIFFEKRGNPESWIITTEGSNLFGLFSLPHLIDASKTLCNNMWEIYETLGIEATRQFLLEEFTEVVSSDGTYVNPAHIQLLVDAMVFYGSIISISRYGARKMECGAISNASFEQSLETLTGAGLKGELENINGVSASILLGKMPRVGTGIVELLVDVPKLIQDSSQSSLPEYPVLTAVLPTVLPTVQEHEQDEKEDEMINQFINVL